MYVLQAAMTFPLKSTTPSTPTVMLKGSMLICGQRSSKHPVDQAAPAGLTGEDY
jgi:hypothetical protein